MSLTNINILFQASKLINQSEQAMLLINNIKYFVAIFIRHIYNFVPHTL